MLHLGQLHCSEIQEGDFLIGTSRLGVEPRMHELRKHKTETETTLSLLVYVQEYNNLKLAKFKRGFIQLKFDSAMQGSTSESSTKFFAVTNV